MKRGEVEHGTINLLSRAGDEVMVSWDPNDPKQCKKAAKAFKDLRKKGCIIYEVETTTHTTKKAGKQITEFNPKTGGRLIARPAMSGG